MNKPIEISEEDRKRFDQIISTAIDETGIDKTLDSLANEPLKYWSRVESKTQAILRSRRRPDGGPLAPAAICAWQDCLCYVQEQIATYKKNI